MQGQRVHYVLSLHQKYGKMVQLSPEEVSVADLDAFREIHRIGTAFVKPKWYLRLRGDIDIFSVSDPSDHAYRRKLFSRAFSKTTLRQEWELMIKQRQAACFEHQDRC